MEEQVVYVEATAALSCAMPTSTPHACRNMQVYAEVAEYVWLTTGLTSGLCKAQGIILSSEIKGWVLTRRFMA